MQDWSRNGVLYRVFQSVLCIRQNFAAFCAVARRRCGKRSCARASFIFQGEVKNNGGKNGGHERYVVWPNKRKALVGALARLRPKATVCSISQMCELMIARKGSHVRRFSADIKTYLKPISSSTVKPAGPAWRSTRLRKEVSSKISSLARR